MLFFTFLAFQWQTCRLLLVWSSFSHCVVLTCHPQHKTLKLCRLLLFLFLFHYPRVDSCFHAHPFPVYFNYFLSFNHPPTSCVHKTKHVHTLAENFPPSPCLVFQGLVEQQEKPQRNIVAMCAEILIRRKWGGTVLFLYSMNLHRWTLAACQIHMRHTEGVCNRKGMK